MTFRVLFSLIAFTFTLSFAGCKTPYKESDRKREEQKRDASGDHSFQAFVGQLRTAVRSRDFRTLAQLMVPDFGYRWDKAPEGETVFSYWKTNNVWPNLDEVINEQFVPHEGFMVAPPKFAAEPGNYPGYRAGVKQINGSWRFVYFVPAPSEGEQALGQ